MARFKDLNAFIRYVKDRTDYHQRAELLEFLKKGNPGFCSDDLFYDILTKIIDKNYDFEEYLAVAKDIFETVCYNEAIIEEIQVFNRLLNLAFDNLSFIQKVGLREIYSLFEDKKIFLDVIRTIESYEYSDKPLSYVLLYIKKARQIWVDENAGYSSILATLTRIPTSGYYSEEELSKVVAEELEIDNHEAGNVDYKSTDLKELSRQARGIEEELQVSASESENLKVQMTALSEEIKSENKKAMEALEKRITKAQNRVKETVSTELTDFRTGIKNDREAMLKTLSGLKEQLESLQGELDKEVFGYQERLKNDVDKHLKDIDAMGIRHYNLLVNLLELHPEIKEEAKVLTGAANKTFDMSVPLRERLDAFYASKNTNELYHENFDKIAKDVIANKVLWIVGPTGSGKSYIFKQIARLAGVPMYNLGFVTDETMDIKGFMDANGQFHSTQFYDAYKYGGVCFFDEIDNSESRALIELNKIMGSGGFETYTFPNKEKIAPHPNFRLVAAGNTWGDGADPKYPDRITVDKAIRNRFTQEKYDYDPNLEKTILNKYPDAYEFLRAFRESVDKRSIGIVVTTRDMTEVRDSLDQECYTPEEIITGRLIQNNRIDVLTTILGDLESSLPEDNTFLVAYKNCLGEMPNVKKKTR